MRNLFGQEMDEAGATVRSPSFAAEVSPLEARRIARGCARVWQGAGGSRNGTYRIPTGLRERALCREPEVMPLFDAEEPTTADHPDPEDLRREMEIYASDVRAAKRVCSHCPLLWECRTSSLMRRRRWRSEPGPDNIAPELHGVWGGMTPGERVAVFPHLRREMGLP